MDLNRKVAVLGRLENELYSIKRRIDVEEDPTKKAKMVSAYRKMSRALTGKIL